MFQSAEVCWDGYAACRMSAMFNKDQNKRHAETVIASVKVAGENSHDAIGCYRLHGYAARLLAEAGLGPQQAIKAVAYLLGGMDAESVDRSDFLEVKAALEDECYFKSVVKLRASTTACSRSGCVVIILCHLLAWRRDFAAVPPATAGWL